VFFPVVPVQKSPDLALKLFEIRLFDQTGGGGMAAYLPDP